MEQETSNEQPIEEGQSTELVETCSDSEVQPLEELQVTPEENIVLSEDEATSSNQDVSEL